MDPLVVSLVQREQPTIAQGFNVPSRRCFKEETRDFCDKIIRTGNPLGNFLSVNVSVYPHEALLNKAQLLTKASGVQKQIALGELFFLKQPCNCSQSVGMNPEVHLNMVFKMIHLQSSFRILRNLAFPQRICQQTMEMMNARFPFR